jgi:hypothetical protein
VGQFEGYGLRPVPKAPHGELVELSTRLRGCFASAAQKKSPKTDPGRPAVLPGVSAFALQITSLSAHNKPVSNTCN